MATRSKKDVAKELDRLDGEIRRVNREKAEQQRLVNQARRSWARSRTVTAQRAGIDARLGGDPEAVKAEAAQAQADLPNVQREVSVLEEERGELEEAVKNLEASPDGIAYLERERDREADETEAQHVVAERERGEAEGKWKGTYERNEQIRRAYKRAGRQEEAPQAVPLPTIGPLLAVMVGHAVPRPGGQRPVEENVPGTLVRLVRSSPGNRRLR